MKYCSKSIEKTLLMCRVCVTSRPRDIWQRLTDFWIKKNGILRLFECIQLSERIACCQKSRCNSIEALCILWKRLSYPYRCKDIIWVKPNWISECRFAKWPNYQPWRAMGRLKTWLCSVLYESGLLNQLQ